jgi:hypothetical protein
MIANLFSPALQVQYPSEARMVIINPPDWWLAFALCALAVLGLILFLRNPYKKTVVGAFGGILLIGGVLGVWTHSHTSSVVIDKGTSTVAFRSPFPRGDSIFPLDAQEYATAGEPSGAYRLVFVMKNGQRVRLGRYSDEDGEREAADAVNRFLGLQGKP